MLLSKNFRKSKIDATFYAQKIQHTDFHLNVELMHCPEHGRYVESFFLDFWTRVFFWTGKLTTIRCTHLVRMRYSLIDIVHLSESSFVFFKELKFAKLLRRWNKMIFFTFFSLKKPNTEYIRDICAYIEIVESSRQSS